MAPPFCTAVNVRPDCESSITRGFVVIVIVTGIVFVPVRTAVDRHTSPRVSPGRQHRWIGSHGE